MLVLDFLRANTFFSFDPATGALAPSATQGAPKGVVMELGDQRAVFFAESGRLHLHLGEERCVLGKGADLSAEVELPDEDGSRASVVRGPGNEPGADTVVVKLSGEDLRKLRIEKGGKLLLAHSYPNPINPPMEFDLGMAEEEDFDLGLFIANVASSPERVDFLLEKWAS
jgi:hypothetical protein